MKILCLLSWPAAGKWLWDYIPDTDDTIDFISIQHPKDRFPGYGKLLSYYPKFWWLGLKAFPVMDKYDVILTWEANTAIPLAFFRTLSGRKSTPLVVLNFVLKGRPVLDMLGVIRFAMRSIDHVTCLSQREINHNSQVLEYPLERFTKLQGPYVEFPHQAAIEPRSGDYIFSAGRSHRDYATLIEAVQGLPVDLIINARPFNVKGLKPSPNVTINPFLPYEEFLALMAGSSFIALPLLPARHASGETFMAQAMSAAKAVIVSETYSTSEMIEPGVNGMLVPPGDILALRQAILYLRDHPQERFQIGQTARKHYQERWSFPVVAAKVDHLLNQIVAGREGGRK
jgi:glycosyltransferase involved in cell wall biosynthesis